MIIHKKLKEALEKSAQVRFNPDRTIELRWYFQGVRSLKLKSIEFASPQHDTQLDWFARKLPYVALIMP